MARRRNRRLIVVCIWALWLLLIVFSGYVPDLPPHYFDRIMVCLWGVALLVLLVPGIFRFVRNFGGRESVDRDRSIRTLFGTSDEDRPAESISLDEREIRLRNAAYYEAYFIMGPILFIGVFFLIIYRILQLQAFFPHIERTIVVSLYVLLFLYQALPRQLILWHEPDMEEAQ